MSPLPTKQVILSLLEGSRTTSHLRQLHAHMTVTSILRDVLPLSRLLDSYADSDLPSADALFAVTHRRRPPTLFMYNSMIRAHSAVADPQPALLLYRDLHLNGHAPDNFTFPFALKACMNVNDVTFGRCVHNGALKTGHEENLYVSSGLIHMYVSCGDVGSAEAVFGSVGARNVVGWTTMIAGYVENGRAKDAVELFRQMGDAGVEPNEVTAVHVLAACAQSRDLETGRWVHVLLQRSWGNDWARSNVVLATAIVDMYGRCGSLKTARGLFDGMPVKNEVTWNAMIGAYNQYEKHDEVIRLFADMSAAGVRPDKITMLGLLGACAGRGAQLLGRCIHAHVEKTYSSRDIALSTSLIDMYAKTGDMESALQLFRSLSKRDVLAWTTMIIGFAAHGRGREALDLFEEMQEEGVAPDHITFIGVLAACSHAGLVEEGHKHFSSMRSIYGIERGIEHYGCMIDLLSRAGQLIAAEKLVEEMQVQPSIEIWGAILNGCEIHGDVEIAERAGRRIAAIDPGSSGPHVLLSNVYAGAGLWEEVEKARQAMRHKRVGKALGCSRIER